MCEQLKYTDFKQQVTSTGKYIREHFEAKKAWYIHDVKWVDVVADVDVTFTVTTPTGLDPDWFMERYGSDLLFQPTNLFYKHGVPAALTTTVDHTFAKESTILSGVVLARVSDHFDAIQGATTWIVFNDHVFDYLAQLHLHQKIMVLVRDRDRLHRQLGGVGVGKHLTREEYHLLNEQAEEQDHDVILFCDIVSVHPYATEPLYEDNLGLIYLIATPNEYYDSDVEKL